LAFEPTFRFAAGFPTLILRLLPLLPQFPLTGDAAAHSDWSSSYPKRLMLASKLEISCEMLS
jgi:hypothetical protein